MIIGTIHKAVSLDDAYEVWKQKPSNIVLGGGTWLRLSSKETDMAVDLSGLGLDKVEDNGKTVTIGAMVTLNTLAHHPSIQPLASGILAQAASTILGDAFRNIATIGGSVAGRFAFSDILTVLLAMETTLVFHPDQTVSLEDFLTTRMTTGILKAIVIAKEPSFGHFHKVMNTANDFSTLSVAIVKADTKTTIVLGARPGVATRATAAMRQLDGVKAPDEALFEDVSGAVLEELAFASNHQATADYRRTLAKTHVRRGLSEVYGHAG
jgi:CO/xanthine dehydrogenase FAD-binding subunit